SVAARKALDSIRRETLTRQQGARLDELLAQPPPSFIPRIFESLRWNHALPEAYLYGFAHAWHGANERSAFFNGSFSKTGWHTFFPYGFWVKARWCFLVWIGWPIAPATAGLGKKPLKGSAGNSFTTFSQTLLLGTLFAFYWIAATTSHLNIGHRHILVTYPPL